MFCMPAQSPDIKKVPFQGMYDTYLLVGFCGPYMFWSVDIHMVFSDLSDC